MMSIRCARLVALGDAAAAGAVHADRVHLVDIGQGAEFVGQVADFGDRAEIAVHRIDRFEGDQLGRRGVVRFQQLAQMRDVVVAEDALGTAIAAHALDHRGVVQRVGIDDQPGEQFGQRAQGRVIGDIGRGEQQRRFLAVQIGQLGLQLLVIHRGAGDVAGAAGACAGCVDGVMHRVQHNRVLAHAQIVVAAPHGDVLLGAVGTGPDRMREMALLAFDVDEGPVTALFVKAGNRCVQFRGIVHRHLHS